jgi:hypothetical protein
MSPQRVIGLVVFALGLVLLIVGINATHSVADSVKEGVTGRYTDSTTWYILGGAAMTIVGGAVAFFGAGRTKSA